VQAIRSFDAINNQSLMQSMLSFDAINAEL
jgi:hypothetical protein